MLGWALSLNLWLRAICESPSCSSTYRGTLLGTLRSVKYPLQYQACLRVRRTLFTCSLQQDFQLSLDQRDVVQGLIGEYAEALVYAFCTMDLASLDATLDHPPGIEHDSIYMFAPCLLYTPVDIIIIRHLLTLPFHSAGQHFLLQRKQHGSHKLPLTDQQFYDMCLVQMADWLEQVGRSEMVHHFLQLDVCTKAADQMLGNDSL